MKVELPLDQMSISEKMAAMEAIWKSLNPVDFSSPTWHESVLTERTRRLESGEDTVSSWEDAKKRLQDLGR